jgi:hypothetical protein
MGLVAGIQFPARHESFLAATSASAEYAIDFNRRRRIHEPGSWDGLQRPQGR